MKKILLNLTSDNNEKLEIFVKKNGITKTRLINIIIADFFSTLPDREIEFKQYLPIGREEVIEKRIRLTKSEYEILLEYAQRNGHTVIQEIIFRLIGTFSKEPTISRRELEVFNNFSNAISHVGRCLNQIAKQMNSNIVDFGLNEELKKEITQLKVLSGVLTDKSYEFMTKSTGRWYYEKDKIS